MMFALGDSSPILDGAGHFVAANATVIGRVRIGNASSIWFNAVLRGDNEWIQIGERSNVQDGSVLHTDPGKPLVVGDDVTIGHMVVLHGCTIGDNSLVGIGSTILNGAVIGKNSIVGAGALVTENKSFPDGSLIIGSPARVERNLTEAAIKSISESAQIYVDNAARFLAEFGT